MAVAACIALVVGAGLIPFAPVIGIIILAVTLLAVLVGSYWVHGDVQHPPTLSQRKVDREFYRIMSELMASTNHPAPEPRRDGGEAQ
jgi:hypothetical protein